VPVGSEPLLLLCGLGTDEECWRDQTATLGGKALVAQGDTVAAMAADVLAQAPPRFALAGHSMGGYIALAIIQAAPERVTRLALLNSNAVADDDAQRKTRQRIIAMVEAEGLDPLIGLLPGLVSPDPAVQERMAAMLQRVGPARIIREYRACMTRPDRRAMLGTIAGPTLVIGSEDDVIVSPHLSREMAEGIPGAEFIMLPQGGHMSIMACADRVTDLLRAWMDRPQAAA